MCLLKEIEKLIFELKVYARIIKTLTLELVRNHRVVVFQCQSPWGNMAMNLDGNRCLGRDMGTLLVRLVPIYAGRFVHMD